MEEAKKAKISAFIVCCNEEDEIQECLDSLKFCDEIVVIDSFSTDQTVEICKNNGARVFQRAWGGYKAQKAYGLECSTHEWVINLDADERVSPELRASIEEILHKSWLSENEGKELQDLCNGYEINRVVHYLGRWWRRGGWYPEYRVRFFRKSKTVWGGVDPHEKPEVSGLIGRLKGELEHYTYRSMDEQFCRLSQHAKIAAYEDFKRGKRATLKNIVLNPLSRWVKFYIIKKGFLEGVAGFIVATIESYYTFMKYARLWELEYYPPEEKSTK